MQASNIDTCQDLQNIQANLTGNYILTNNLNCSNDGKFSPIGNETHQFRGTLDGNSKTISNVEIDTSNSFNYTGLFAVAMNATVKNITFIDISTINITQTQYYLGLVFGAVFFSNISNIHLKVSNVNNKNILSGNATNGVGSVIGLIKSSFVENITVENTIVNFPNGSYVGGLFGLSLSELEDQASTIKNCHNLGIIFHI